MDRTQTSRDDCQTSAASDVCESDPKCIHEDPLCSHNSAVYNQRHVLYLIAHLHFVMV
jgi:hypothetical protein